MSPRYLWARLIAVFRRRSVEDDIDEELQFHIHRYAEDLESRGIPPAEAARRSRVEFGNVAVQKEECRSALGLRLIDELTSDVRYGLRRILRTPGFSAIAILSLGMSVGAATALFSAINSLLLQPLPVTNPDDLVEFSRLHPEGARMANMPFRVFSRLQDRTDVLADLFAIRQADGMLLARGVANRGTTQEVSASFFPSLGVNAFMGHTFGADDDRSERERPVAVLSYSCWARRFGRDPSILGANLVFDGRSFAIVGIMPPDFFGMNRSSLPDFWQPLALHPEPFEAWIFGRLRAGISIPDARTSLEPAFRQGLAMSVDAHADAHERSPFLAQQLVITRATNGTIAARWQYWDHSPVSKVLVVLTGLVLLIACVNLAHLLTARGIARSHETAIRLAIGADRARLIRELLTESLLLSTLGSIVGLSLAIWGQRLVLSFFIREPDVIATNLQVGITYRVLEFALVMSIGTVLLFGLLPALLATRDRVARRTQAAQRVTIGARIPFARTLLGLQVALSMALMVGVGLSARTLRNLSAANLGFERNRLILVQLECPTTMPAEKVGGVWRDATERIRPMSVVQTASFAADSVFSIRNFNKDIQIGIDRPERATVAVNVVDRTFFATVGIPVLRGRDFTEDDSRHSPRVAVVNRTFARRYFGDNNPIGQYFREGRSNAGFTYQIVGMVGDVKAVAMRRPAGPMLYQLAEQIDPNGRRQVLHVRSVADPGTLVPALRRELAGLDDDVLVSEPLTFPEIFRRQFQQERVFVSLITAFAVLALVLAGIGVYAAVAFRVARRTTELGVRKALGASGAHVAWLVTREILPAVTIGMAIGAAGAVLAGRVMSNLLFGLVAWDPVTLSAALATLAIAGTAAAYPPARRAMRVDPNVALRWE